MSSADRVSLFSSESPSFLAIWSLFLKILVGAYVIILVGHALVTEMYVTAIFELKIHGNSMVTTTCT